MLSGAAEHRPSATQARPRLPQGHPGPSLPRGNRQLRHAIDIRPVWLKQAASAKRPSPSGQVPGRRAAETHRKAVEQRRIKTGGQSASPRHEHNAGHLCGGRVACTGRAPLSIPRPASGRLGSADASCAAVNRFAKAEIRVEGFCPAARKGRPLPCPGATRTVEARGALAIVSILVRSRKEGDAHRHRILHQAVGKPLGQAKRGSGEQVTAANPSLCRRLSSARPRFSRRLAG